MTISYNTGIPNPPNNPSADVPLMQINTNSINSIIGIDHNSFNTASGFPSGYHSVVHFQNQGADPTATAGFGQLYTKTSGPSPTQNLYFRPGGTGVGIQISTLLDPKAMVNGYSFIAGGIIMQWGIVAVSANVTNVVNFLAAGNIAFPTAIFNVQFSTQRPTADPGSTFEFYIDNTTVSQAGFTIINRSTHSYGYYWTAIGN